MNYLKAIVLSAIVVTVLMVFFVKVGVIVPAECHQSTSSANGKGVKLVDDYDYQVWEVEIKGHKYLVTRIENSGTMHHSESCPCKKGDGK